MTTSPRDAATAVVRTLAGAGHTAYFAGGCVRDSLLGRTPKDYDVATGATPGQVESLFPGAQTVGAHFGVVIVKEGGHHTEVATFRTDGSYSDGRRPDSVTFSSPEEDAQRRDFTVNGLFLDPLTDTVHDFVGGRHDLDARVLRAIGEPAARFAEDHLRLLRAVRFAAVLGFEIEPSTWDAVCGHATEIASIAPERIREEVARILVHPQRLRGFDLLVESGLMAHIWPEILELKGCEQPPQWHPEGDVFVHTRLMLGMLPPDASLTLVLSVLFHDIAKPATYTYDPGEDRIRFNGHDKLGAEMARDILRRLRFPNDVVDTTCHAVGRHMQFMNVKGMRTAKLKRFMAAPDFADEMELHRVDCQSSNGFMDNYEFLQAKAEEFASEPLIPEPFVTGRDLIDRGHRPGPRFKAILTDLQNLQLDGTLTSREDAIAHLEATYPPPA